MNLVYRAEKVIFLILENRVFRLTKVFIPLSIRRWMWNNIEMLLMKWYPDRLWLNSFLENLPPEKTDILFVGCRRYNRRQISILLSAKKNVQVIDVDPYTEKFRSGASFAVCNLVDVGKKYPSSFDLIVCNGVFGDGLDEPSDQLAALHSMKEACRQAGTVLIGLNTAGHPCYSHTANKMLDELEIPLLAVITEARHAYYFGVSSQLA